MHKIVGFEHPEVVHRSVIKMNQRLCIGVHGSGDQFFIVKVIDLADGACCRVFKLPNDTMAISAIGDTVFLADEFDRK